jgi:nucleolar protein 58
VLLHPHPHRTRTRTHTHTPLPPPPSPPLPPLHSLKLKAFKQFEDTASALEAATASTDRELSKSLKKFLKKNVVDKGLTDALAIEDTKMASVIKGALKISCVHDDSVMEVFRGIRTQLSSLLSDVDEEDLQAMRLGLAHSLGRYKLKFSPDKVDTMIVQAINLLDELDKEINTYAMRVREWYGWHFPEVGKIILDNLQFARTVQILGMRSAIAGLDFSAVLDEDVEAEMRVVAEVSMGTDISDEDVVNVRALCEQVISLSEYRGQLFEYLKNRMQAIAPNLTILVGELVGARLIAHAGSLMNLAKQPASTVQILGAEKALFRALKTKKDTPKYGLIYHASLIGQAAPKHKGKISRVLAAKCSLAIRVDALGDGESDVTVGTEGLEKVEARLRQLEGGEQHVASGKGKGAEGGAKAYSKDKAKTGAYNDAADSTLNGGAAKSEKKAKKEKKEKKRKASSDDEEESTKKQKKEKKEKKKKKERAEAEAGDDEEPAKKKKKKKKKKDE